jgi:hypothetical protein
MHMHVLIVDDYPDTAETACQLLESAGHECRAVTCGADALAAVDAFRPDLAIIDIDLPDMDGRALIAEYRDTRAGERALPPYSHRVNTGCTSRPYSNRQYWYMIRNDEVHMTTMNDARAPNSEPHARMLYRSFHK